MKFACPFLLLSGVLACQLSAQSTGEEAALRRAVVKIWSVQTQLSLSNPWMRSEGRTVSGSGVWIGERRILTNAHVVERATQVSIQTVDSSDRLPATVKIASPEMDLAILELESDEPFAGLRPASLHLDVPSLRSAVRVYGFPEGGNSLSVTEGIVSRVEFVPYFGGTEGLRFQIDAAVNHGNSGGPALLNGRIVGIAFQRRQAADNIGYLIPSSEVQLFLTDIEDGRYDGKEELHMAVQRLQHASLRESLGLPKEVTGVWVRSIRYREDTPDFPLRVGDVLTHIGEHPIDNGGVCPLNEEVKVVFTYFLPQLVRDDKVPFRVYRNGVAQQIEVPLQKDPVPLLRELKGSDPDWFLFGPYVFSEVTSELIRGLETSQLAGDERQRAGAFAALQLMARRRSPILSRRFDIQKTPGEQLVFVANWLPHRVSTGYGSPQFQVVQSVNGQPVRSMRELVERLRDVQTPFVTIDFADQDPETQTFRRADLLTATTELMNQMGIPRQGSTHLVQLWQPTQQP